MIRYEYDIDARTIKASLIAMKARPGERKSYTAAYTMIL